MSRFTGMETSEHPTVLAFVICERIIVEEGSKRRSLIGMYDRLTVADFPINLFGVCVHVTLARGEKDEETIYLGLFPPMGEAILKSELTVSDWGTSGLAYFDLPLSGIGFPTEGDYDLRLFSADHVFAQRKLVVRKAPQSSQEQGDSPTSSPDPSPPA